MSNKKAEASDRHNIWIRINKEIDVQSIKLHQVFRMGAISAHGSKVLNEEWITKKLALN